MASLDPSAAASVLSTLRLITHEAQTAVLCSLHQVDLATSFADRITGMRDGRIVADLPAHRFGTDEHAKIYRTTGSTLQDNATATKELALHGQADLGRSMAVGNDRMKSQ
ncbi:MAG: hypothetical protein NVS2B7_38320 [Herpetosiphon sp.]